MCCFDLHVPAVETQPKQLIRKTTRLLVSHEDMKEYLQRRCPGEGCSHHAEHAKIAGSHPAVGKVSRHAGVYTPQFVRAMLDSVPALRAQEVLIIDEEPNHVVTSEVLATEEEKSASDEKLIAVLRRLHNNLGHPSTGELIRVLKHGQASERALALAAKLSCSTCESLKAPAIPNPAAVSHVSVFNHKIGIDVKHLQGWRVNQKIRALNIVDYASNFQLMIPFFETETAVLLRQLLNDRWLSWAGPPREIVLDPARTNLGKALTEPCELEGSHVSIIAAGAHWQLGKTEVHGGLFAKVLSRVLEERSPQTKEEWLDCVRHCHIKNSTIQTHGFTPSQVVFGKNPEIPGELLNEPQHVVPCTASLLEDSVERAQSIRYSAKKAILEMQDDRSMRRALAARPRLARNFRAGDIVAYWRDQKWIQGKLSKGGRWYGSAVVIGHIGKNVVLAHRSHVLRCAPEQVRLATSEEKQLIETPETQLLGIKDMLEGGTFRSAQYVDLLHQAYPPSEDVVMQEASRAPDTMPASAVPADAMSSSPAVSRESAAMPESVFDDEPPVQSAEMSQPAVVVTPSSPESADMAAESPAPAEPSSGSAGPNASDTGQPTTYRPLRRVPSKTGPMALFRPMLMQHDDFVEVLSEVLPHMIDNAVHSSKRTAPASDSEPAPKMSRTEQMSVQHEQGDPFSMTSSDAEQLWESLQQGQRHEVLIAQYLQKRMQKELPHSNNEPFVQAQIDAAKTLEWNTLSEKNAVRLLSVSESEWVKKHRANRIMGSRFVITKKALEDLVENGLSADPLKPDHWKVKARWCLQGHLDPDLSSKAQAGMLQSPTLSQMGRMVLFQMLASHRWTLQLGDIKGAFLEAGPLNPRYRPLYAWLPAGGLPGADSAQLVEVLGNAYGQHDAPASWYKVFDDEVLTTGFCRSKYDPCLYYMRDTSGKLCGVLGSMIR